MEHYNTLGEIGVASVNNDKLKHWRFRVRIIRIYPLYSNGITGSRTDYVYVLADEHVSTKSSTLKFLITTMENMNSLVGLKLCREPRWR